MSSCSALADSLHLFFHDCFISGCDASVLVYTNNFNYVERDSDINLSLPGDAFNDVILAKTKLEIQCLGVISRSDIMALATCDLLLMLMGTFYKVRLGRKDALTSAEASVKQNLPLPNITISEIIKWFADKGFTVHKMVALFGVHIVGFSRYKEFVDRTFNHNGKGATPSTPA